MVGGGDDSLLRPQSLFLGADRASEQRTEFSSSCTATAALVQRQAPELYNVQRPAVVGWGRGKEER